jgi:hypothetical protein
VGRIVAKNLLVAVGALVPLLVIDYFFVRSGQNPNSIWTSQWLSVPSLLVAPVGFFWANWGLVGSSPKMSQVLALVVLAIIASAMWFLLLAGTVVGNFHIAMGGRI